MKRKLLFYFLPLVLVLLLALIFYSRRSLLLADPYWDVVVGQKPWQQILSSLARGRWLVIRTPGDWESGEQQLGKISASQVIFTPYWRDDLAEHAVEHAANTWALSPTPFAAAAPIRQVVVKRQPLFKRAGEIAFSYLESQEQRQQVLAYFYGGEEYDDYAIAFAGAFAGHDYRLSLTRYYTSQWDELKNELGQVNLAEVVLVFALTTLNPKALNLFENEEELLFITEDNRRSNYLGQQMFFSIETDYRGLLAAAQRGQAEIDGYLYAPDTSPLAGAPGLRQDSKLLRRLMLLWN